MKKIIKALHSKGIILVFKAIHTLLIHIKLEMCV